MAGAAVEDTAKAKTKFSTRMPAPHFVPEHFLAPAKEMTSFVQEDGRSFQVIGRVSEELGIQRQSAAGEERLPGDVGGVIGGQKGENARNLLR